MQGLGGFDGAFGAFGPVGAFEDPAFDEGDLFDGDLVAFGGHGFGVGSREDKDFEEGAVFGVAREDDGAFGAGGEGGGAGLEFEVAHEGAVVVAVDAVFFEYGADVGGETEFGEGGAG